MKLSEWIERAAPSEYPGKASHKAEECRQQHCRRGKMLDVKSKPPRLAVACRGRRGETLLRAPVATLNPITCVARDVLDQIDAQPIGTRTMTTAGESKLFEVYRISVRVGSQIREIEAIACEILGHPMVVGTDLVRLRCGRIDVR